MKILKKLAALSLFFVMSAALTVTVHAGGLENLVINGEHYGWAGGGIIEFAADKNGKVLYVPESGADESPAEEYLKKLSSLEYLGKAKYPDLGIKKEVDVYSCGNGKVLATDDAYISDNDRKRIFANYPKAVIKNAALFKLEGLITINGKDYYRDEKGNKLTGWQEIGELKAYFDKNGVRVKKSTTIDGVRYKFNSEGWCVGTYTGWVKSKGKYFYYNDGIKQTGWVNVEWKGKGKVIDSSWHHGDWYYIDPKEGRLTGEQTINGNTYKFDKKGLWDKDGTFTGKNGSRLDIITLGSNIMSELSMDDYGGVYLKDGMCVVLSVDGKAEKAIERLYPNAKCVIYKKADYSLKELEAAKEYFMADEAKNLWSGLGADAIRNRLIAESEGSENFEALKEFVETLPCKDMIIVEKGGHNSIDVATVTI